MLDHNYIMSASSNTFLFHVYCVFGVALLLPCARTGGKALLDAAKEMCKQSEHGEGGSEALTQTFGKGQLPPGCCAIGR